MVVLKFSRPVSGHETHFWKSRLGLELQVSISSLGLEKLWSRNMRSLETQNFG